MSWFFSFPFLPSYQLFDNGKYNVVSDNFTTLAFMVKVFYENTKQNMELAGSYKEITDIYFESLKKLYIKWLDNEEDKTLKTAFFLSDNMGKGLFDESKMQSQPIKKFKSEADRDKTLSSLYF